MVDPRAMVASFSVGRELFEYFTRIADEGHVNSYVFVDFGTVDLNVNIPRAFGVRAQVSGDAVIEAHADGNEEVGFLNRVVHTGFTVHAHHAEVQRIIGREAADAKERHGHGIIAGANELLEGAHRAGNHNAVTGENDGALGGVQHFDGAVEFSLIVIVSQALGRKFWLRCFPVEVSGSLLRIFRDVDKHGARTTAVGDQESFTNSAGNVLGFGDNHVVLGDGHGDARDIDFLKCVGAQHFATNLARNADHRRRVHHGRGYAGNHVGCARAGGGHGHADATAGARVAIGHVRGALFVAHEDVVQLRFTKCIIDRQNRAAGITKDLAHAQTRERFAKNFCTSKLHEVLAYEPAATGPEKIAGTAVTAPRDEEETSRAYLAMTPLVKRGWGGFHAARRF